MKIDTTFSTWTDLITGVPQESVLGPLPLNIYLNDPLFILWDVNICNFADDTTFFVWNVALKSVLDKLEGNSELAIFWFENNYMKLNTDKRHVLVSGTKYEHTWPKIVDDKIWETNEVKLLDVVIDNKFKSNSHIENICFKSNQKLNELSRLASLLTFD